jgi:hypothetical protein
MSQKVNITSPVGRIVRGNLYEPQKTDMDGRPLVIKSGPNAGQARVDFNFALAIPKNPGEQHWAQTPWGAQIWAVGHQAYPQQAGLPGFSWKVTDGDDQTPSMKSKPPGKRPCDNEGWKGHWIIKFSGGFAPKIYQIVNGNPVLVLEKDFIKPGYYAEVAFSVDGNTGQTPGVYMNHSMVCFRGFGPEISFGPDVSAAGFGQAALPQGASAIPPASLVPMPVGAPQPQVGYTPPPPVLGAPAPGPVPGYAPASVGMVPTPTGFVPPAVVVPPAPVVPNMGFVAGPGPAPAPVAVPLPPAPPAKQMTAAAGTTGYAAYIAAGWTDALLIQNGLMMP